MSEDPPPTTRSDHVGYDPTTDTYHAEFDTERGPDAVVVAIVETVGTVTDRKPTEVPPLYRTIHPYSLGELVNSPRDTLVDVAFTYAGVRVRVTSRGDIVVHPLGD